MNAIYVYGIGHLVNAVKLTSVEDMNIVLPLFLQESHMQLHLLSLDINICRFKLLKLVFTNIHKLFALQFV